MTAKTKQAYQLEIELQLAVQSLQTLRDHCAGLMVQVDSLKAELAAAKAPPAPAAQP